MVFLWKQASCSRVVYSSESHFLNSSPHRQVSSETSGGAPESFLCRSWPVSAGEGTAVPTPLEGHRPAAPWGTRRPHGRNHTLPRRRGRVSVLPVLSGEGSVLKALGLQQRSVTAEHTSTFRGLPWKFSQVPLTLHPCTWLS